MIGPARQLPHYPTPGRRRAHLGLVVLITVALYYALYVGGGVAPLMMRDLGISFDTLVFVLAVSNLLGAFASLLAGAVDRFGRADLIVWGLLLVALLTAFAMPAVHGLALWAAVSLAVGFVEGVILVATPALTRDFSPQVGRATAMGFWAMGPVLGSLVTSAVLSATLGILPGWRAQFRVCGIFCVIVFVIAFFCLRELKPSLRDQVIASEQDRALIELRAQTLVTHSASWSRALRPGIVASALGVSLLLLVYYTTVAFGVIYLATVFGLSPQRANALLNWNWAANAVALLAAGLLSDRLLVRKPFMLAGSVAAAGLIWLFLAHSAGHPSFAAMALTGGAISVLMAVAYATWMANFTEMLEAIDPALTGIGLAVWGWLLRLVVTVSFLVLPHVVTTVTVLVRAPATLAALQANAARHLPVPPQLAAQLHEIARAAGAAPGQWQTWYAGCALGALAFALLVFAAKGRWSPLVARRDAQEHAQQVKIELARLRRPGALPLDPAGAVVP